LNIPTDYESLFRDRLLIITGVGRSGTTILGKLIGSMSPVYYLFEPAIFKYHDEPDLGVLFEDYFLPLVQGRNLNPNKKDDSWYGHYYSEKDIRWAHENLSSRKSALDYVREVRPLFVVKSNDRVEFPKHTKVLVIFRETTDVIKSSIAKGWYSDEYMESIIELVNEGVPHYIDQKDIDLWPKWDQNRRCVCVVNTIQHKLFCNLDPVVNILTYYSALCDEPQEMADYLAMVYKISQTAITRKHIRAIKKHKPTKYSQ